MKNARPRRFTLFELLVVVVVLAVPGSILLDIFGNAKSHAYTTQCRSNLKIIGGELSHYRRAHGGSPPPSLGALPAVKRARSLLECIETGGDGAWSGRSYVYRRLKRTQPSDIIAWDKRPHRPTHSIFRWKNLPFRQVLRADGSVSRLSEDDFAELQLRGTSERIR